MLRVLHIIGVMDRAGAETMIMNLYRNIDRSKIQFDFLVHTNRTGDYDEEIKALGGKIYHIEPYRIYNLISYKKACKRFFAKHPYQVVHGHIGLCAPIYLKYAKLSGALAIAHSHGENQDPTNPIKFLEEKVYHAHSLATRRQGDYFITCSKQAGIDRFGAAITASENCLLLPNAINLEACAYDAAIRLQKRLELGLTPESPVYMHAGRMTWVKNHPFLLEVFSHITKLQADAILLLCGRGEDEPALKELAEKLGISSHVRFLGLRNDVSQLMSAADVFLFPSFAEGLPVVSVEAQAAGLPCIFSNTLPPSIKMTDQVYFESIDNAQAWAKKACELQPLGAARTSSNLDAIRKAGFDITQSSSDLCKLYQSLAQSKLKL